jgi:hypothetical protein
MGVETHHYPRCNRRCQGDDHFLKADPLWWWHKLVRWLRHG